jgi:hypothetical protein
LRNASTPFPHEITDAIDGSEAHSLLMRSRIPVLFYAVVLIWGIVPGGVLGDDDPQELVQARSNYLKEIEFATRPIRDRYGSRLDVLKRTLGARGDARGAAAVQDEIDALKSSGTVGIEAPKLAGAWFVNYGTSGSRRITLKADGSALLQEINGSPVVPARPGKLVVKGPDLLLEFDGDPVIERITASGGKLSVENFNPKASYPVGPPAARGIAVKASPGKP